MAEIQEHAHLRPDDAELDKALPQTGQFLVFDLLQQLSRIKTCLLYTSDAADDLLCVDLGGRRIIKKKNTN